MSRFDVDQFNKIIHDVKDIDGLLRCDAYSGMVAQEVESINLQLGEQTSLGLFVVRAAFISQPESATKDLPLALGNQTSIQAGQAFVSVQKGYGGLDLHFNSPGQFISPESIFPTYFTVDYHTPPLEVRELESFPL